MTTRHVALALTGASGSIAAAAILAIFVFAGWRMHWRIMREKMAAALSGDDPSVRGVLDTLPAH